MEDDEAGAVEVGSAGRPGTAGDYVHALRAEVDDGLLLRIRRGRGIAAGQQPATKSASTTPREFSAIHSADMFSHPDLQDCSMLPVRVRPSVVTAKSRS